MKTANTANKLKTYFKLILHFLIIVLETVLLLALILYGVIFLMIKGPSGTMSKLFVRSVQETSALKFIPSLFLTDEELLEINAETEDTDYDSSVKTESSLISISASEDTSGMDLDGNPGWEDTDGDGIIIEEIHGNGYSGFMMIVLDPSRVIMGCVPEKLGIRGYTVSEMAEYYDAAAAINAGGFYDPNGTGDGSTPDTLVVFDGEIYYSGLGTGDGFAGIDSNHILHVGKLSYQDIVDADIQYGVCFGPALIINGEIQSESVLASGVNPRTAIGQRADGAFLFLVIDGRQVISLGATYTDLAEIMTKYGAVNACNLDGGSSSLMWYNGEYINNCASVIGIRRVPSTFLVLKEGSGDEE